MAPVADTVTVTISSGQSLSGAANIGKGVIVGFAVPTITNAALTFQGSADGDTYYDVYDDDGTTETSIGASTGARFVEAPTALVGLPFIKVRSGTTGSGVNQGADRAIVVISK